MSISSKKASIIKVLAIVMIAIMSVVSFAACGETPSSTTTATLTKVEVTTQPSKTEYEVGESFDFTGAKVTLTFDDGTTQELAVTNGMVGYYDFSTTGAKTVTLTYTVNGVSKSANVSVTVVDTLGTLRANAAKEITTYDKAQAVKNDTVIVALTEAYVSSVNQAASADEAAALVTAYKNAVDAYVGAGSSSGDTDYDAVLDELKKQAEQLEQAIKDAQATADAAAEAALVASLKVTQKETLAAAYAQYKAADYQAKQYDNGLEGSNLVVYAAKIDNYAVITDIYTKAAAAVNEATTADGLKAVVETALADMDAVKTVKEIVYDAVVAAMAEDIVIEVVYRGFPWASGDGWDEVLTFFADDSNKMITDLENLIHQCSSETFVSADVKKYVTESKLFNEVEGKLTDTCVTATAAIRAEYQNLVNAKASAELAAYYAAVDALTDLSTLKPAIINAQATAAKTDGTVVYTDNGSKAAVDAIDAAYNAFVEKFFKNDKENANIARLVDTNLTVANQYKTGYLAKVDTIKAAWTKLQNATLDAAVKDLVLSVYYLGSGELKVTSNVDKATTLDKTMADGVVLFTDYDKIAAYKSAYAAFKAAYELTDAQALAIVTKTDVAITGDYTHKKADGKTNTTDTITIYVTVDSGLVGTFAGADFTEKLAATNVRAKALNDAYALLSKRTFNGIKILDAIASYNNQYTVITYTAIPDARKITKAMAGDASWLEAAIANYGAELGGQLGADKNTPALADPNYNLMFGKTFFDKVALCDKVITAQSKAADAITAIEAIGTPVATTSKAAIDAARLAYNAFAKYVSDNLDASNMNLLAKFENFAADKFTVLQNAEKTVTYNEAYYTSTLLTSERSLAIAYIAAIGNLKDDGTDFVDAAFGVGDLATINGKLDVQKVVDARAQYDAWAKNVTDKTLVESVKIDPAKPAVTVNYVAVLEKAEAKVIYLALGVSLDNAVAATDVTAATGAADSATRLAGLAAYKAWVATGAATLNADGETINGAKVAAIIELEAQYVKNVINAIGDPVYAVEPAIAGTPDHADAGALITAARTAYDAYIGYYNAFTSYTVKDGTALKTVTVNGKIDNYATLTDDEVAYANARALAVSINVLVASLPATAEGCYTGLTGSTAEKIATLNNYLTVLNNVKTLYNKFITTNVYGVVKAPALTVDTTVTNAHFVTVNGVLQDYCMTAAGDTYAAGTILPAGTVLVTSYSYSTYAINNNAYAIYLAAANTIEDTIARVEYIAAELDAQTTVAALYTKYNAEALTSDQMTQILNLKVTALNNISAIGGTNAGDIFATNLATKLAALDKAVSDCEKAMKAALN